MCAHLGANLVAALASLNVNDFPHGVKLVTLCVFYKYLVMSSLLARSSATGEGDAKGALSYMTPPPAPAR